MTAVDPRRAPRTAALRRSSAPARPFSGVCPYLAAVDGEWRSSTAAREHRCGAVTPPAPLAAEKQRRLCLTHDHVICATYDAAAAARPVAHDRRRCSRARSPGPPRSSSTTAGSPSTMPGPPLGSAGWPGDPRSASLAIAFAAIVLTRVTDGGTSGGATGTSHSPGQSVDRERCRDRAPPASGRRDGRSERRARPHAGQRRIGGPSGPAASAAATQTYKVKAGDTLVGIAAKFGTTPKAIATLNGISDPTSLHAGQILKIP